MITFPPANEASPSLPDFSIWTTITHEIEINISDAEETGIACRLTIRPDGQVGLAFEYYGDHIDALERCEIPVFGLLPGKRISDREAPVNEWFITPARFRKVLHALSTLASTLPDDPE